jgi:hypothetical protein
VHAECHLDVTCVEDVREVADGVVRMRLRHSVSGNDDDLPGVPEQRCRFVGGNPPDVQE